MFSTPTRLVEICHCRFDYRYIFFKISQFKMINRSFILTTNNIIHYTVFSHKQLYIYCRHNHSMEYASKVEMGINKQINAEHEASLSYLKLAVNFLQPCVSRQGVGGYFIRLYNEEIIHMHCLVQYQLMRGCKPIIGDIQAPKIENIHSICQAFELALQLENNVTKLLKDLVKTAESEGDYHCADFVTTKFLSEQLRSKNELSHHLTNLSRISDNEHALFNYDKSLFKKFPYVFNHVKN